MHSTRKASVHFSFLPFFICFQLSDCLSPDKGEIVVEIVSKIVKTYGTGGDIFQVFLLPIQPHNRNWKHLVVRLGLNHTPFSFPVTTCGLWRRGRTQFCLFGTSFSHYPLNRLFISLSGGSTTCSVLWTLNFLQFTNDSRICAPTVELSLSSTLSLPLSLQRLMIASSAFQMSSCTSQTLLLHLNFGIGLRDGVCHPKILPPGRIVRLV